MCRVFYFNLLMTRSIKKRGWSGKKISHLKINSVGVPCTFFALHNMSVHLSARIFQSLLFAISWDALFTRLLACKLLMNLIPTHTHPQTTVCVYTSYVDGRNRKRWVGEGREKGNMATALLTSDVSDKWTLSVVGKSNNGQRTNTQ